ncbi:hypothetical protein HDV05_008117, partial [Chytridiales sp. JEL 0842]
MNLENRTDSIDTLLQAGIPDVSDSQPAATALPSAPTAAASAPAPALPPLTTAVPSPAKTYTHPSLPLSPPTEEDDLAGAHVNASDPVEEMSVDGNEMNVDGMDSVPQVQVSMVESNGGMEVAETAETVVTTLDTAETVLTTTTSGQQDASSLLQPTTFQPETTHTTQPDPKPKPTPDPALLKSLTSLLKSIQKHPSAWPFLSPVDPTLAMAPDYFDVIKNPMDFGTIEQKLCAGEYHTPEDFVADVRLVFDNCYTYNPPEHAISELCRGLEAFFRNVLNRVLPGVVNYREVPNAEGEKGRGARVSGRVNKARAFVGATPGAVLKGDGSVGVGRRTSLAGATSATGSVVDLTAGAEAASATSGAAVLPPPPSAAVSASQQNKRRRSSATGSSTSVKKKQKSSHPSSTTSKKPSGTKPKDEGSDSDSDSSDDDNPAKLEGVKKLSESLKVLEAQIEALKGGTSEKKKKKKTKKKKKKSSGNLTSAEALLAAMMSNLAPSDSSSSSSDSDSESDSEAHLLLKALTSTSSPFASALALAAQAAKSSKPHPRKPVSIPKPKPPRPTQPKQHTVYPLPPPPPLPPAIPGVKRC